MSDSQTQTQTEEGTNGKNGRLASFFREKATLAQTRVQALEQSAGRYLSELVDKGRQASELQRKKLESLVEGIRQPELLEKAVAFLRSAELRERLHTPEVARRFAELRSELLDLFGLATREEVDRLKAELAALSNAPSSESPAPPAAAVVSQESGEEVVAAPAPADAAAEEQAAPAEEKAAKKGRGRSAKKSPSAEEQTTLVTEEQH